VKKEGRELQTVAMVIVKEAVVQLDEMAVTYNSFSSVGISVQSANADMFG
jgi:hypothetical protein